MNYKQLEKIHHFHLEEFQFARVFVKRCLVSNDSNYVAISVRGCQSLYTQKQDYYYYYQIWSLLEGKCVNSYRISLCTTISQFMCCFSNCSYYFASFNCNCTLTIVYLKEQKQNLLIDFPGHEWIIKININNRKLFTSTENLIYIHNIYNGNIINKYHVNYKFDNILFLNDRSLILTKQPQYLVFLQCYDKISKKKELCTKNYYDEIQNYKDNLIIGCLQNCIHLISIKSLKILRKIYFEYQFSNIIVDKNIWILNTYRSMCPKEKLINYIICFPQITEQKVNQNEQIDYTFENMYFYSKIIIGWDYDNKDKQGFKVYKFS